MAFDPNQPFEVVGNSSGKKSRAAGMIESGNIDLDHRPVVKNADGSISTVRSIGVNIDGREVLIPTVSPDGKILSNQDAVNLYKKTGQHLGMFADAASSEAYAQQLHNEQADKYLPKSGGFDPSQPFEAVDAPEPHPLLAAVKDAIDRYKASQQGSPQDLLEHLDGLVSKGMNKAGEFAAENAAGKSTHLFNAGPVSVDVPGRQRPVGPETAAALGTAIQMAPDLAQTISPTEEINLGAGLKDSAKGFARRALGFTKIDLKTPFAQKAANTAAEVALENKVLPWTGNPKEALARAGAVKDASGEALGAMREGAGTSALDPVFNSLEDARQKATNGLRGGAWDTVHAKFDQAQETLLSLLNKGPEVSLKEVENAKKLLGNTVNWMADNVSQQTAKDVTRAIENGVEDIMRSKGMDMAAYDAQKRTYGASKTMEKVLTKRVSADQGNNMVSLPTAIGAAGQLATGNPGGALATMGILEAIRRRGASPVARLLNYAADRAKTRVPLSPLAQLLALHSSGNQD